MVFNFMNRIFWPQMNFMKDYMIFYFTEGVRGHPKDDIGSFGRRVGGIYKNQKDDIIF